MNKLLKGFVDGFKAMFGGDATQKEEQPKLLTPADFERIQRLSRSMDSPDDPRVIGSGQNGDGPKFVRIDSHSTETLHVTDWSTGEKLPVPPMGKDMTLENCLDYIEQDPHLRELSRNEQIRLAVINGDPEVREVLALGSCPFMKKQTTIDRYIDKAQQGNETSIEGLIESKVEALLEAETKPAFRF